MEARYEVTLTDFYFRNNKGVKKNVNHRYGQQSKRALKQNDS
jgi:hypothetical protein